MNTDQRVLENCSVGYNNDSSTYRIHDEPNSPNKSSEVSCCEKNNPPSSMADDTKKGVRVQMILKTYTMGYKTWKLRAARVMLETIIQ